MKPRLIGVINREIADAKVLLKALKAEKKAIRAARKEAKNEADF